MKVNLCDFCRKVVSDEADLFITVIVTNFVLDESSHYSVDPNSKTTKLEMCEACASAKGILKMAVQQATGKLAPNVGALTDEEIAELERMP